jgi:RNA polymerase sigma-70 factor (ECF subfamily)
MFIKGTIDPSSAAHVAEREMPGVSDRQPLPSPTDTPISDEQLMTAHAAGDPEAFGELYRRYASSLLHMMVREHHRIDRARDLVRETFLQVHRARADYDPTHRFRPWIYAIARNLSREALREREPTAPRPEATGLAPTELHHAARAVRAAVRALPRDEREVIELSWFDGLDDGEIAQTLGLPPDAVKVRSHRGYQSLRASLKNQLR